VAGRPAPVELGSRVELAVKSSWEVERRQCGQHIMLRVRPKSTWRRTTSQAEVAALIMAMSLTERTPSPQAEIS